VVVGSDTIVAVATPAGRGGIGIVRLSGPAAEGVARKFFRPKKPLPSPWPSLELVYGEFVYPDDGSVIDNGYAVRMAAPNSFTGEEVVELHGHGSPVALQRMVAVCISTGARLAEPGEFTKRAFLHGKIDLVQTEAVAEFIAAQSEAELAAARRRLDGKLSSRLHRLREETISILAECEADIDFPEEGLSLVTRPRLLNKFEEIQQVGKEIRATYESNQHLQTGFQVVLIGRPNVGKSSLFNALLSMDRAIVTEVAGTTRDILREEILLNGRRVRIVDTAGLRESTQDAIERIGMDRTTQEMKKADVVCLVCDSTAGFGLEDQRILDQWPDKEIWLVWNKVDLEMPSAPPILRQRSFMVSALRGDGVAELQNAIGRRVVELTTACSDGGISNDRQRILMDHYLKALDQAEAEGRKGGSAELVAFELRQAHRALSRIVGKDESVEDILSEIFSRFCIGK